MDARIATNQGRSAYPWFLVTVALFVGLVGCQGPFMVSHRYSAEPHIASPNGELDQSPGSPSQSNDGGECTSLQSDSSDCRVAPGPMMVQRIGLPRWCRPFLRHSSELLWTEQEIQAPHSRFHPVPTQPVFSPRDDYTEPQLMLEAHRANEGPPRLLPNLHSAHPLQGSAPPPAPPSSGEPVERSVLRIRTVR